MSTQSLQSHVERCFKAWQEQNPGTALVEAVAVAEAITELHADGVTTVAQLEGFDIEQVWER